MGPSAIGHLLLPHPVQEANEAYRRDAECYAN